MRDRVGQRLAELQAEHRAGEKLLADLEAQRADLEKTLLRISGAIQVLEELLIDDAPAASDGAPTHLTIAST